MNNAELVKFYRWCDATVARESATEEVDYITSLLDGTYPGDASPIWHFLMVEMERMGLPAPTINDCRWVKMLDSTPWVYCHDCGEITTALDDPPLNGPCDCHDDPPPWIVDGHDIGFDPTDDYPEEVGLRVALWGWAIEDDSFARAMARQPAFDTQPESMAEVLA